MRKLFKDLKNFIKEDFNLRLYLLVLTMIVLFVQIYYAFDIEERFEKHYRGSWLIYLAYFLVYTLPYYFTCLLTQHFTKYKILSSKKFWIRSLFALALLTFDKCFYVHKTIYDISDIQIRSYYFKIIGNGKSLLTILLPLLLFYFFSKDKKEKNFYGLSTKAFNVKPYLFMLLMMIPLIYYASTTEGFLDVYPFASRLRINEASAYLELPRWFIVTSFEILYSWDFVMVELLLRGFFVVGMLKVLGKHAVLPMTVVYCFYHFGKPIGETYSSVMGGYILGILAYYSKSIWGGVFIHLGVALLMELFAWVQLVA